MKRLIRTLIIVAIIVWAFPLALKPLKTEKQKYEVISVVTGSETRAVLERLAQTFHRIVPPLRDGKTLPVMRFVTQHPLILAKGVEAEDTPFSVWLSPHNEFVTAREQTVPVAKQYQSCTTVFSSRIGLVGPTSFIQPLPNRVSDELLSEILKQDVWVGFPDPIDSATGWSVYRKLSCTDIGGTTLLTEAQERSISVSESEQQLVLDLNRRMLSKPYLAMMSEDSFKRVPIDGLSFLPLEDERFNLQYSICIAPSLTKIQSEGADLFESYLATPSAKEIISAFGFTPASHQSNEQRSSGSCRSLLEDALSWPKVSKPQAKVIIIDRSSSMDGAPLANVKSVLNEVVAHAGNQKYFAVVTIGLKAKITAPLSSKPAELVKAINGISVEGGSAVYDAILKGTEALDGATPSQFLREMVVITDGQDSHSETSLFSLEASLGEVQKSSPFALTIVGLKTKKNNQFEDLKELARSTGGRFFEVSPSELRQFFSALE